MITSTRSIASKASQISNTAELVFYASEEYYATDILDEFIAFCEDNQFNDALDYINSEFDIDGVYDVFSEDNDNWTAVISWLRGTAAIFQGYELDFEQGEDRGEKTYVISGEIG